MPVQQDTPTGIGAFNDWGVYGPSATDKVQAVSVDDADSSVIFGVSGGRVTRQSYTFPQLVGVADPVTEIVVVAKARMYMNGGGARVFLLSSNGVDDTNNWGDDLYAYRYQGYQTCTFTPVTVTLAAANGEQGFYCGAAGGPSNPMEIWVTYFYRQVTFTFNVGSAGDFAHLVSSVLGAAIGANLLLRDMTSISQTMRGIWKDRRCVWLQDHELEPAWRDWQGYRHPVFSR